MRLWLAAAMMVGLAACSSAPNKGPAPTAGSRAPASTPSAGTVANCANRYQPAQEDLSKRGNYTAGGLYAPGVADTTPDHVPDVDCIAEPVVTREPLSPIGNRSPYKVLGKQYVVRSKPDGYVETGIASYYGNKFHGRRTSNQEVYDMYAFTAAHKTLPLPSFARVTNLDNGKSVVVRVNDRGPFHDGRVIDLSYAAAVKLGITQRGTGRVEVRALTPGDDDGPRLASNPAAASVASNTLAAASQQPTAIDNLVRQLPDRPSQPASALNGAQALAATNLGKRYHVRADTENAPSADKFDAWMKANNVRITTGKPGTPVAAAASTAASATRPPVTAVATSAPVAAASTTVAAGSSTPAASMRADAVQLQVASFASRDNADRALARLTAAGIAGASLSDINSNGRTLWRLRVAAADTQADALAARIAGLGFGQPQKVRE
ncbi:septal ring lytic transglycosylase RlpA family protein [Pseudoxanthomonas dokdonensis]|uniref:Endolytic peptidoglycan transglycosylase RlpA n=1 Tax=Pseudoxanthomonas dokdonensis TaxID=344882 RepID=A0A0R0CFQ6_9GAMM|nr:septal ring lytic transglycosylase RlpA family protein [Pseudoxanthomonas dokdonensis]KRG68620.1 hypothetical protein ABB29_12605 [Pseudoxanthomonas dokdonensis]